MTHQVLRLAERADMLLLQLLCAALLVDKYALADLITTPGTAFSPNAQPTAGSTGLSVVRTCPHYYKESVHST